MKEYLRIVIPAAAMLFLVAACDQGGEEAAPAEPAAPAADEGMAPAPSDEMKDEGESMMEEGGEDAGAMMEEGTEEGGSSMDDAMGAMQDAADAMKDAAESVEDAAGSMSGDGADTQ